MRWNFLFGEAALRFLLIFAVIIAVEAAPFLAGFLVIEILAFVTGVHVGAFPIVFVPAALQTSLLCHFRALPFLVRVVFARLEGALLLLIVPGAWSAVGHEALAGLLGVNRFAELVRVDPLGRLLGGGLDGLLGRRHSRRPRGLQGGHRRGLNGLVGHLSASQQDVLIGGTARSSAEATPVHVSEARSEDRRVGITRASADVMGVAGRNVDFISTSAEEVRVRR